MQTYLYTNCSSRQGGAGGPLRGPTYFIDPGERTRQEEIQDLTPRYDLLDTSLLHLS